MADTCLADIDTHIDANPTDITAAADWLGKLKTGFDDAYNSLVHTSTYRAQISGHFGLALNEYTNDIKNGCESASSELTTTIDVINSWHDQVVWRKQDMAGYRDDAKAGGLTVEDDRYIKQPEEVADPGTLPKGATDKQKSSWQTAHDGYTSYVAKKKLWTDLQSDATETRRKLTNWVAEHMTVNSKSPLYETILAGLLNTHVEGAGLLSENAYYTEAYKAVRGKAIEDAAMRHYDASKSRLKDTKEWKPDREAVVKRTNASMPARVSNAGIAEKATKVGKRVGTILTFALSGWDICNGKSPSQIGIETATGLLVGAGVTALAAGTLPAWGTAAAGVVVGTAATVAVGKAYENWVPLRTRERIDEGIKDTWNATAGSAWKAVFG